MPKEKILNCKIQAEVKSEFERICSENFTTPSHELRLFVHQYIKRNKGSQVLISDLKHKRI